MELRNIFIFLIFVIATTIGDDMVGHLKPLGEQRESEGHIEVREDIPDPITFHKDYILASKPVVFKGAAKNIPAFHQWTDDYMKEKFGDLKCDVEEGKKENRSMHMWNWTYREFLEKYQKEDVYMVNSLRGKLLDDLRLFPCISCGGYSKVIQDVIMWFSSGGTKSVLHNDNIDNINCLFSGVKQLYMVDKKYEEFIDFDAAEGAYSLVDVDSVDLETYPGLSKAPWWRANMEAGDCLFIPTQWFHQVRSHTNNKRNMAVNIWFYHLPKINKTDCENNPDVGRFVKFNGEIGLGGDASIKFLLKLELQNGPLGFRPFKRGIKKHLGDNFTEAPFKKAFKLLDKNGDKLITIDEVDALESSDLPVYRYLFPMAASNMEEEEDGEDPEDVEVADEEHLEENDSVNEKTEL